MILRGCQGRAQQSLMGSTNASVLGTRIHRSGIVVFARAHPEALRSSFEIFRVSENLVRLRRGTQRNHMTVRVFTGKDVYSCAYGSKYSLSRRYFFAMAEEFRLSGERVGVEQVFRRM